LEQALLTREKQASSGVKTLSNRVAVVLLTVITTCCLLPFVGKAFHMDDPLFLWSARQIRATGYNFYGFPVNWYGMNMPMAEVMKNPPLTAYYIAGISWPLGWGETALHIGFLLPALATVIGIYYLAQEFCTRPLLATLVSLFSPAFLISSTSVMCDTMMLAFWVWAVFFWVRGINRGQMPACIAAGALVSVCALTKYFGMSLIPLLALYALAKERRLGRWALALLIPVIILGGYQWLTVKLYGRGLLSDAAAYTSVTRAVHGVETFSQLVVGLAFLGGCLIVVLLSGVWLWSKRQILLGIGLTGLLLLPILVQGRVGEFDLRSEHGYRWDIIIETAILALGGLGVLALAMKGVLERRNPEALFLGLWCFGTFVFASLLNWTVNGRSILPLIPAAGILLARQTEEPQRPRASRDSRAASPHQFGPRSWRVALSIAGGAAVALLVAWGDYRLAGTARAAANEICDKFSQPDRHLWFQGHWGFQYYMAERGAVEININRTVMRRGDRIASPLRGTNLGKVWELGQELQVLSRTACYGLTPHNREEAAGYYASVFGPLPYGFVGRQIEQYGVYQLTNSVELTSD
jgi:4-amino-4-deoxy-L-arabinose transferase-like glycosyltransferase